MATFTTEDEDAFKSLAKRCHEKQGQHFLNAYWETGPKFRENPDECEKIWTFVASFAKLDKKGREGCELDEFEAHQFLEHNMEAMTVVDMREAMRKIDINFDKMMCLLEFLIFKYEVTNVSYLVNWVAAGSPAQQKMLAEVQAQMSKANAALAVATETAESANAEAARAAEAELAAKHAADVSEESAKAAQEAKEKVEQIQKEKADAIAVQEKLSQDETLSTVKKNKAMAQLKILLSEDSQPLRTAQITLAAAERAAKKNAKAAADKASEASAAKDLALEAADKAEKAMEDADAQVASLSDQLEEAKAACAGSGSEEGTFWWLDREFEENLKFMGPKQRAKAEAARRTARARSVSGA